MSPVTPIKIRYSATMVLNRRGATRISTPAKRALQAPRLISICMEVVTGGAQTAAPHFSFVLDRETEHLHTGIAGFGQHQKTYILRFNPAVLE